MDSIQDLPLGLGIGRELVNRWPGEGGAEPPAPAPVLLLVTIAEIRLGFANMVWEVRKIF